jgi:hypothetical protein
MPPKVPFFCRLEPKKGKDRAFSMHFCSMEHQMSASSHVFRHRSRQKASESSHLSSLGSLEVA